MIDVTMRGSRFTALVGLVLGLSVLMCSGVQAETLWINSTTAVNYNASHLKVAILDGGTIEIKTTTTNANHWLHIPYAMPTGIVINSVEYCYELATLSSYVAQVRLAEIREPGVAWIRIDDTPDQSDVGPACLTTRNGFVNPIGHITLSFRFEFADTNDWIRIGGIGLNYNRPTVDVSEGPTLADLHLGQNFPNPFSSSTTIEYNAPEPGAVEVRVYTVAGRLVRTLGTDSERAGVGRVIWDGRDEAGRRLTPGVYFYRVQAGGKLGTKTMVLAR
jgi:hypothetical protein